MISEHNRDNAEAPPRHNGTRQDVVDLRCRIDDDVTVAVTAEIKLDGSVGTILVGVTENQIESAGHNHVVLQTVRTLLALPDIRFQPYYTGDMKRYPTRGGGENTAFVLAPSDPHDLRRAPRVVMHVKNVDDGWEARITERFPGELRPVAVSVTHLDYRGGLIDFLED